MIPGNFRASVVPELVLSVRGSLSWLYICLHDTTTKCHAGVSFTPVVVLGREFHSSMKSCNSIM